MGAFIKKYSIHDLNALMEHIRKAADLNEGQIMARIERNEGYISQLRSRKGEVPAKLIQALKAEFKQELDRNNIKLTTVTEKPKFGDKPTVTQPTELIKTVEDQAATIKNLSEVILNLIANPR